MRSLISVNDLIRLHREGYRSNASGVAPVNNGDELAVPLTHTLDHLALTRLIRGKAATPSKGPVIRAADLPPKVGVTSLDLAAKEAAVILACHHFAQLVREHKCRLVTAVQTATDLQSGNAHGDIDANKDSSE